MRPICGKRAVVSVSKSADAAAVLSAAVTKFAAHDCKFVVDAPWTLHYPDGTVVQQLPEGTDAFRLDHYKDQLMKEYQRITLFISAEG